MEDRNSKVVVYSNGNCSFCRSQINWMKEKEIDFITKDIKDNEDYRSEFLKIGAKGIPFTVISKGSETHQILGFNKTQLEQFLL